MKQKSEARLSEELMAIDMEQLRCLRCSPEFYGDICRRFIASTAYRDPYEMMEYLIGEENERAWRGFPEYIREISHRELFDVFNIKVSGEGVVPKGFSEGDKIHPMLLKVLEQQGCSVVICEKSGGQTGRIGIVTRTSDARDTASRNRRRELNKEVFEETMRLIDEEPELSGSVLFSKQNTSVIYEGDELVFVAVPSPGQEVEVSRKKSFEAAADLHREYPGSRVAVLNFANPIKPGGAVKEGFEGQEESLCRCSTLYRILSDEEICGGYYQYNKSLGSYAASDSLIYTKDVVVFRKDGAAAEIIGKEAWVKVDVITAAAPYTGEAENGLCSPDTLLDADGLYEVHVRRAKRMLAVAASKGAEILVLGAFGCGAFKNDPNIVAKAFKTALSEFPEVFRKVEFAIYCSRGTESENYRAFKDILG